MPQNSDPNLITFDIAVLKGYIKNSHDIVTFRDELLLGGFSTEMLIYLAEIVDQDFASKTPRLNKRVIFQVFRNLIKIGGVSLWRRCNQKQRTRVALLRVV